MTPQELLEAQKEQTPLVWAPHKQHPHGHPHEIVTVYRTHIPGSMGGFVQIRRASGVTYTNPECLKVATAQDLLELAGEP